jgi:hypothetical protein
MWMMTAGFAFRIWRKALRIGSALAAATLPGDLLASESSRRDQAAVDEASRKMRGIRDEVVREPSTWGFADAASL